ncbi:MAG: hypothetical protein H6Q55_1298 [Deltaproteobacteria bacterium]|nr:hypothetical protein [Deltaproteobacteria bacterium]
MPSLRRGTDDQELDELLRSRERGPVNVRPACGCIKLTSMRRDTILRSTMLKRGLILLLAILLLGLPIASAPAGAGGCCGSASEQESQAGGAGKGRQANNPDKAGNVHTKCCCGDPTTCTCHLTEDETAPSPDAVPVSTNTDQRPGLTEVHAALLESVVPHRSPATPLVRFTFARAPSSDIYVLNHNFLC